MCLNDVGMAGGGWPGSTTTPRAIFASNISRFHIFSCPCTEWNLSNCKCWLTRLSSLDYLLLEVEYCAGKWWRQVVVAVVESRWVHLWICNQYTNNQKSLVDGWQQSVLFGETSRALQLHLTIKWTKSEEIVSKCDKMGDCLTSTGIAPPQNISKTASCTPKEVYIICWSRK